MFESLFGTFPCDETVGAPVISVAPPGSAARAETSLPMPLSDVPIFSVLDSVAARLPDRPAMDFFGRRTTYAELADQINRACRGFQNLGVGPGSRVGLCLPNSPFYVVAYFAVLKAGATVVNVNPLYVERELLDIAHDSKLTVMVTLDQAELLPRVQSLLEATSLETIVVCSLSGALPMVKGMLYDVFKRSEIADYPKDPRYVTWKALLADKTAPDLVTVEAKRDIAVLQYTGGTTGIPKAAMLTHTNLTANVAQMVARLPNVSFGEERMMSVIPFFHVFAMTSVMNYGLVIGAELILLPRFDLQTTLDVLAEKKATLFPAVPTIYTALLSVVDTQSVDLSALKFGVSGGAPLPIEVKQRFEAKTGCILVEGYGLSEATPVVCCNPPDGEIKAGSVGPPVPGTIVEIRSPLDSSVLMPMGEQGEICVRGPQVMAGYWNRPDDTADVFVDGALRTGDIGYIDADGYVYLVDRMKDVILCGGYNVYPRVIEEALYQHPAVADAIVIGLPDDYRGEAPKAYVQLRDGIDTTSEELRAFLGEHVSKIELPREIEIRDRLPRTAVGKLSKKILRDEERAAHEKTRAKLSA